ncbi:MAG: MinD/ParA family protein [Nanoarchaeota archaeon]|nr:MinD/ParA family protein [Nanoarchaeota archaeon]MBU1501211.1 MinD/ParA family protein [Nanoarchaeota archaeon]MBU2459078.1 MinD/ParA family protein [Nanoarchaeota archaeon]
MGKTVGIISLKGGVGKTSVVSSLGAALSLRGKKVLLIDGNLSSPTLGLHLNVVDPEKTLHHVLNRSVTTQEAIYDCGEFHIMPSSIFENVNVSPLMLRNRIRGLKRSYDVILIDSSPSLNEETLAVMLASDEILVVTTPDRPTLSATIKAIKLAKQRGTPISGLILNKVNNKNFEVSFEDVEETLDVPVLAVIPYDVAVLESLSNMMPYPFFKPKSKGSEEFRRLAAVMVGEKYKQARLKDFFRKLTPNRQEINREIFYKSSFE